MNAVAQEEARWEPDQGTLQQEEYDPIDYVAATNIEPIHAVGTQIFAEMEIDGHGIKFQLDSGASVNLINVKHIKKAKL